MYASKDLKPSFILINLLVLPLDNFKTAFETFKGFKHTVAEPRLLFPPLFFPCKSLVLSCPRTYAEIIPCQGMGSNTPVTTQASGYLGSEKGILNYS